MTTTFTYANRTDAIEFEIAIPIEESGRTQDAHYFYDLDAIADAVLGDAEDGWAMMIDADDFWTIVDGNARSADAPYMRDQRTGQRIRPTVGMRVTRNHVAGTITGPADGGSVPVHWDIFKNADACEWVWALDLQPAAY